jgi:putative redox protein
MISTVTYQGELRTACCHLASNNEVITDAPTDNHGKGETFSPTDLMATSLAACMLTVMGIKAQQMEVVLDGAKASVLKVMASEPRRISEIHVKLTLPGKSIDEKTRKILENTGKTCPVFHSLHPDIKKEIEFSWE